MLRTSERDGNDSSVGCLPKGARRSTRLYKWTSGGFSIDGLWVHQGIPEPGANWERILEDVREERIESVLKA